MVCHHVSKLYYVFLVDDAVLMSVFDFQSSWECALSGRNLYLGRFRIVGEYVALYVRHTFLQRIYSIDIVEVVNGIEAVALVSANNSHRCALSQDVVVSRHERCACPTGTIESLAVLQLVNLVEVHVVCQVHVQIEVL